MTNPISSLTGLATLAPATATNSVEKASGSFEKMLTEMVSQVNSTQTTGDQAINKLQTGEAKHLHEVMIAVEEADVSLRMLVQIRNKALTAYEEIMRMQV